MKYITYRCWDTEEIHEEIGKCNIIFYNPKISIKLPMVVIIQVHYSTEYKGKTA